MTVSTFAAAQILRFVPRVRLSRAVGRLCELQLHPMVADTASRIYAKAYGVNLGEVEPGQAPYSSFDAFFTRRLRSGARSIDRARVTSPADGKIVAAGKITSNAEIFVKGRPYDVAELCGYAGAAALYNGGQFAVVYLHPRDYHRVHAPVAGEIRKIRSMGGDLFPVNAIGEQHVPRLFVRNQRVNIEISSPTLGTVAVVMVGATIVGRITTVAMGGDRTPVGEHVINPAQPVNQGDEIGTFHLGSTAVLLLPPSSGVVLSTGTGPVLYGESLEGSHA
ncbi:MAG TPA: archaetidylserine decarboxylase [Polyangiaceae bacterium]|nr:archaetidylserine decarboxylase [Polyangiaceae bacterium]